MQNIQKSIYVTPDFAEICKYLSSHFALPTLLIADSLPFAQAPQAGSGQGPGPSCPASLHCSGVFELESSYHSTQGRVTGSSHIEVTVTVAAAAAHRQGQPDPLQYWKPQAIVIRH